MSPSDEFAEGTTVFLILAGVHLGVFLALALGIVVLETRKNNLQKETGRLSGDGLQVQLPAITGIHKSLYVMEAALCFGSIGLLVWGHPVVWKTDDTNVHAVWLYCSSIVCSILFFACAAYKFFPRGNGKGNKIEQNFERVASADPFDLPIMCYVADPNEPATVIPEFGSTYSETFELVPLEEIDTRRLPLPYVLLPFDETTCGMCLKSFVAPTTVPGQEKYLVTEIIQTPCEHYFHVTCAAHWFTKWTHCPNCHTDITAMLMAKATSASQDVV